MDKLTRAKRLGALKDGAVPLPDEVLTALHEMDGGGGILAVFSTGEARIKVTIYPAAPEPISKLTVTGSPDAGNDPAVVKLIAQASNSLNPIHSTGLVCTSAGTFFECYFYSKMATPEVERLVASLEANRSISSVEITRV